MRFIVGILVLLLALVGAQSSATAQTVVRAHAIASAGAFDPASFDPTAPDEAPARPRKAPITAALADPADDHGAEHPVERSVETHAVEDSSRARFARAVEALPRQRVLGPDVPPPR